LNKRFDSNLTGEVELNKIFIPNLVGDWRRIGRRVENMDELIEAAQRVVSFHWRWLNTIKTPLFILVTKVWKVLLCLDKSGIRSKQARQGQE